MDKSMARLLLSKYHNEMWGNFCKVTRTPDHDVEIEAFIEAKDRASKVLSILAGEDRIDMDREYEVKRIEMLNNMN